MLNLSTGLGIALIIFSVWIKVQSSKIDELRQTLAEKQTEIEQAEKLLDAQEKTNRALIANLENERKAVEQQAHIVKTLKEQANETRETIRKMLKDEPCANTRLPNNAIERLRQPKHNH